MLTQKQVEDRVATLATHRAHHQAAIETIDVQIQECETILDLAGKAQLAESRRASMARAREAKAAKAKAREA